MHETGQLSQPGRKSLLSGGGLRSRGGRFIVRRRSGRAYPESARRIGRRLRAASVHPAQLGRSVGAVGTGAFGRDLEVLTELLVAGLRAQPEYVFPELVPVQVEREGIEQER